MTVLERIYDAYPDADLIAAERGVMPPTVPNPHAIGDGLFVFLCNELADRDDPIDDAERVARCERAINDIRAVQAAFLPGEQIQKTPPKPKP